LRDEAPKGRSPACIHCTSLQEFATVVAQGYFVAVLASIVVEVGIVGVEEPIGFVSQQVGIAAEELVVAVEVGIAEEEPVVAEQGPAAAEEELVDAEVVVYIGPGAFEVGEEFARGKQVGGLWYDIVVVIGVFEGIEVELVLVVAVEPEDY
jgi:hypothetical protein